MKKIKNLLTVFTITLVTFSCSKDDSPTFSQENPLDGFATATNLILSNTLIDSGDYEFGLKFTATVNGNINSVTTTIPGDNDNLRITIWDVETEAILRTETITNVKADVQSSLDITPLAISKDKEYMITFNNDDWYDKRPEEGGDIAYPINIGNISITAYGYISGTEQLFPTSFPTNYYAGDLSFGFQQTN